MKSFWFVMPVYKRVELTKLCLDQLRWTCDRLAAEGLEATAAIVGDEEELLEYARSRGFWTTHQENEPLGRKFNDGFQLACDQGADYITPFGSDNWAHPSMLLELPENWQQVVCRRLMAIVREDGERLAELKVTYDGGDGIRTFDAELFRKAGGRPAADHARRAVDTSIVERLRRLSGWNRQYVYRDVHALQVIGFQSTSPQLNEYRDLCKGFGKREHEDPWSLLADEMYPAASVEKMRLHYQGVTA